MTEPADLRHVDTWLFDLDNTLYPAESGFMGEIERRMTAFVQKVTGLPRDDAYRLQKDYLREHGLTLIGLMKHHGVEPAEFHALFHDLSLEALAHDPELLAALERLPGRRLIFTNADDVHAERVLARLGLADLFDDVFHIGLTDYRPKPDPAAFAAMNAAHGIAPATAAFFEDSERNLAPAAELGMTTVLVGPHAPASAAPFVHHRTARLAPFLAAAQVKEAA
ncbi:pyrimidine 5'-nucleotidase [Phenylobacterium sp.]|jgi:putative hydrolase of the HAD superfamily|uniref:pyrimidine 5'-nucleotidase n=1 Tax=Phenylobacterium sp. TaxID=1871053 RepID=UPI002F928693